MKRELVKPKRIGALCRHTERPHWLARSGLLEKQVVANRLAQVRDSSPQSVYIVVVVMDSDPAYISDYGARQDKHRVRYRLQSSRWLLGYVELSEKKLRATIITHDYLRFIYNRAYWSAERILPVQQKCENELLLQKQDATVRPGCNQPAYVMIVTVFDLSPRMIKLSLDYANDSAGAITARSLHKQLRKALNVDMKVSVRVCPFRPWFMHMTKSFCVPEHRALAADDRSCSHLLGTTMIVHRYV